MGKRANPMAVKAALTYDIKEAARAFGVTSATIRNWIKDGLPVMSERKPYLMLGLALREYLRAKYKAAKRPLGADQLFCPACKEGTRPYDMQVTLMPVTLKTDLLKGVCGQCGGTCTRMISKSQHGDFAQTFIITKQATSGA